MIASGMSGKLTNALQHAEREYGDSEEQSGFLLISLLEANVTTKLKKKKRVEIYLASQKVIFYEQISR